MPQLQDLETKDESVFLDLYDQLNDQQKEAVDTTEGPVMVIAGAGTGKTQILAMRIANILRNPDLQMDPHNILCLTFTESAVVAMRKRLVKIIGSAAYYVRIHTFHSFCNEIIKDNPERFLFSQKASFDQETSKQSSLDFISDLEQIELMDSIIDSLPGNSPIKPYGDPYFYRGDLINSIKTLKREAVSYTKLLETVAELESFINLSAETIKEFISKHARSIKETDCDQLLETINIKAGEKYAKQAAVFEQFWQESEKISSFKKKVKDFYEKNLKAIPKQKDLAFVYQRYLEALEARRLYDFEDMILWVTNAFANDPELLAKYQEQFQYILVDEYQDTNGAQNKILEHLTSYHGSQANIFVVGDDDQSIFRFQGASIENIVFFYRRYKETAKFIVLENNYRSHQTILDASHSVIENNQHRISNIIPEVNKKLTAKANITKSPIELYELDNPNDEVFFIASKVKELIGSGTRPEDIAILFRKNSEAIELINIFSRLELPFRVEAGSDILKDMWICQLIDLMNVVANPKNDNLVFNVLNYDFLLDATNHSYEPRQLFEITRLRSELNRESNEKSKALHLIDLLADHDQFSHFAMQIFKWQKASHNLNLDELFELIIKESNFLNHLIQEENKIELLNRLNTLFDEVKKLSRFGHQSINKKHKESSNKGQFMLKDFLKYIELLQENGLPIIEASLQTSSNAVSFMTAHKSKGLEYKNVFVINCTDKNWGNRREMSRLKLPSGLIQETESFAQENSNEDERRLFYVALTRAKEKAFISYPKTNPSGKSIIPSMFIEEIDQSLVTRLSSQELYDTNSELEKLETNFIDKNAKSTIEAEASLIQKLLENYKLSVTHLNNYLLCPQLFYYRNLLRVPAAKNKHASFGTAVHAALYDLFMRYRAQKLGGQEDSDDLDFLLERFEYHLTEENLSEKEESDSLDFGKDVLSKYYKEHNELFNKDSLLEFDFSKFGVNYNDLTLTGKLDKIEIISKDEKTINVVDYKTGNPSNKGSELKAGGNYHRQVVFYKLLCEESKKAGQFPYSMQSGEIDFVQSNSDGKFIKKRIEVTDEDINKLKEEIDFMKAGLLNHNFAKTEDKKACEKCDFYNLCWK